MNGGNQSKYSLIIVSHFLLTIILKSTNWISNRLEIFVKIIKIIKIKRIRMRVL